MRPHRLLGLTQPEEEGGSRGEGAEHIRCPLAQERIAHALIGEWEDDELGHAFVYDALHDRQAMALWLAAFARHGVDPAPPSDVRGDLMFHRLPGHDLDIEAHSTLFSGEQSNSSVAFGEDALMKVFRKVTPGVNPDIAIHQVLTEAGITHVAALYGWLDLVDDDTNTTIQLAMLQQFLRTASDGWDLALASVRNLFAEADLHADEVGGDFAGEAARLGTALAEVHADLASFTRRDGTRVVEPGDVELRLARHSADASHTVPLRMTGPVRVVGDDRHLLSTARVLDPTRGR